MAKKISYSDRLVEIDGEGILFRRYYFPWGARRVAFSEMSFVEALEPTLANGKWRIWGTGDFRTWFPCDWKRPSRERVFMIHFKARRGRIGFTVESSRKIMRILRDKELLKLVRK